MKWDCPAGAIIAVRSDEEYSREVFSLARVLHFCLTGGKSQVAWDANLQVDATTLHVIVVCLFIDATTLPVIAVW